MTEQSISASDIDTGRALTVRWRDGVITGIDRGVAAGLQWIAPTLCDIQVNGYAGIDFQADEISVADLNTVVERLLESACSQILLTLITDDWSALMRRMSRLRELRNSSPALRAAFPGFHIEGPFLCPTVGFKGAHEANCMIDPTPEKIRELRAITGDDPVLLTLAPERPGAIDAIALATSLGMRVSCGHTDASLETLAAAAHAGATMFTHLGNGCPQQLDRHDNIIWRAIDTPALTAGIIPDCIHVSPMFFRILNQALFPERFYYTTDCMAAAGCPPGRYRIGRVEVEVGADKIVRQPGKSNFAGSALTPIEGVFRAARMLRRPWQHTWHAFSTRPRELMGLSGRLSVGSDATFCVLEQKGNLVMLDVFVRGAKRVSRVVSVEC